MCGCFICKDSVLFLFQFSLSHFEKYERKKMYNINLRENSERKFMCRVKKLHPLHTILLYQILHKNFFSIWFFFSLNPKKYFFSTFFFIFFSLSKKKVFSCCSVCVVVYMWTWAVILLLVRETSFFLWKIEKNFTFFSGAYNSYILSNFFFQQRSSGVLYFSHFSLT